MTGSVEPIEYTSLIKVSLSSFPKIFLRVSVFLPFPNPSSLPTPRAPNPNAAPAPLNKDLVSIALAVNIPPAAAPAPLATPPSSEPVPEIRLGTTAVTARNIDGVTPTMISFCSFMEPPISLPVVLIAEPPNDAIAPHIP